jgi:hypothetical protein
VQQQFEREEALMDAGLLENAVSEFERLRGMIAAEKKEGGKNISTSELLDWCKALHTHAGDEQYKTVIASGLKTIPFASVLVKNWDDHLRFILNRARQGA